RSNSVDSLAARSRQSPNNRRLNTTIDTDHYTPGTHRSHDSPQLAEPARSPRPHAAVTGATRRTSMFVIGLTGQIGCGKSTAAAILAQNGAFVLDADELYRELVSSPGPLVDQIVATFGEGVRAPDGSLDRRAL